MERLPIPYLLKIIVDRIRTEADSHLKSLDLTLTQSRVLAFIIESGGQTTQKEIENFLQVSHPTVVGIVSRMEKNGFLTCSYERISKTVTLTDKANAAGEDMVKTMAAHDALLLKGLSESEADELRRLLLTVYQNIS
ncbi:MAG TPA: MarR family transcriptional regulator [Eubacteriales bacterium]|nr:MarR family transcriptional regulator [Clostridia bacterium]HRV73165.1 MarR family transcriptional regulator [Eubacteriales bacterium]